MVGLAHDMKRNATCLGILMGGIFVLLLIRLSSVQLAPAASQHERVAAQTTRLRAREGKTLIEKPSRGRIVDRRGRVLAESWFEHDLVLDPAAIVRSADCKEGLDAELLGAAINIAEALGAVGLEFDRQTFYEKLVAATTGGPDGRPRQWLQVARGLDPSAKRRVADALRRAKVRGFSFEDRLRRTYPWGATTSQVLGIVGEDPRDGAGRIAGRTGLEWQLDRVLDGVPGVLQAEMDAAGRELMPAFVFERPIQDGASVAITLDAEIQRFCLDVLGRGVPKHRAKNGSAVVLDARTAEVLAACTWPSTDPDQLDTESLSHLKLGAFLDLYEPGSTIKPVFYAWALQNRFATLDTVFDCGGAKGYETFGPRTIREYSVNREPLSFEHALVRSSNVAAVRLGYERLGLGRMYDALEAFGLEGRPLLGYPSVARCRYTTRASAREIWTGTSFPQGYEMMLSPLGIARMFVPFANRGEMIEPALLLDVRGQERIDRDQRARRRRVLDPEVAATMLQVLEQVVEAGTGKPIRSARFSIAAKTGTPKIQRSSLYNPVVCAMAPVAFSDPAIIVVVLLHNVPNRGQGTYSGGSVSGPLAKEIIERTLSYLGVPDEPGRKDQLETRR